MCLRRGNSFFRYYYTRSIKSKWLSAVSEYASCPWVPGRSRIQGGRVCAFRSVSRSFKGGGGVSVRDRSSPVLISLGRESSRAFGSPFGRVQQCSVVQLVRVSKGQFGVSSSRFGIRITSGNLGSVRSQLSDRRVPRGQRPAECPKLSSIRGTWSRALRCPEGQPWECPFTGTLRGGGAAGRVPLVRVCYSWPMDAMGKTRIVRDAARAGPCCRWGIRDRVL